MISFIALLFISHNNLYSQIDNWLDYSLDCDVYNNEPETSYGDEIYDSRNGCIYSPHGVIRFLVVFVELEYDNPNDDPFLDGTEYWGVGELPVWANSLFAAYDTTDFINKQVTKYYRLASSNDHIVLGDYLLAPDNGGVFKIHTADGNIKYHPEYITPIINQKLGNNIITASGTLSSISDFDKWTPGSGGIEKDNVGNGRWDYVVYIIRNSIEPKNSNGCTTNGNNSLLLGHKVDFYSMQCAGNSSNPIHVIRHEYAHMLLGGNEFHTCGECL